MTQTSKIKKWLGVGTLAFTLANSSVAYADHGCCAYAHFDVMIQDKNGCPINGTPAWMDVPSSDSVNWYQKGKTLCNFAPGIGMIRCQLYGQIKAGATPPSSITVTISGERFAGQTAGPVVATAKVSTSFAGATPTVVILKFNSVDVGSIYMPQNMNVCAKWGPGGCLEYTDKLYEPFRHLTQYFGSCKTKSVTNTYTPPPSNAGNAPSTTSGSNSNGSFGAAPTTNSSLTATRNPTTLAKPNINFSIFSLIRNRATSSSTQSTLPPWLQQILNNRKK